MLDKPNYIYRNIKESRFPDNLILLAIFLFPILTVTVRHWLSGIFSILALASLFIVFRRPNQLYREEMILFILLALLLASFVISASLNGWSDSSLRRIGNVLKYVFFFPFYLLLRQYSDSYKLLITGILLGAVVLGLDAVYEIYYLKSVQATGVYGSIIFGNLAALFFAIIFILLLTSRKTSYSAIYLCALTFAIIAVFLSGSRNAWLAAFFSILIIPLLCYRSIHYKKIIPGIITAMLLVIVTLIFTTPLMERLDKAYTEFSTFVTQGAPRDVSIKTNSVAFRLEQWRSTPPVIRQAPFFGHGGGNAGKVLMQLAEQGLAHPDFINPHTLTGIGGLHSTYFETVVNEGLIGLVIMLMFLLYPIYIFYRARSNNPVLSAIGVIFIGNYMIFGITENPFVHDNFTSVYLLFLTVLFSEAVRTSYETVQA